MRGAGNTRHHARPSLGETRICTHTSPRHLSLGFPVGGPAGGREEGRAGARGVAHALQRQLPRIHVRIPHPDAPQPCGSFMAAGLDGWRDAAGEKKQRHPYRPEPPDAMALALLCFWDWGGERGNREQGKTLVEVAGCFQQAVHPAHARVIYALLVPHAPRTGASHAPSVTRAQDRWNNLVCPPRPLSVAVLEERSTEMCSRCGPQIAWTTHASPASACCETRHLSLFRAIQLYAQYISPNKPVDPLHACGERSWKHSPAERNPHADRQTHHTYTWA